MNKNKVAILIVILFTVIVLVGTWFYLQYIMVEYDIDKKDWDRETRLDEGAMDGMKLPELKNPGEQVI